MKLLFVCLGNICRSPMAQGIMEKLVVERNLDWIVDSAGTGSWHIGEMPDARSIAASSKQGVDISKQRGRKIRREDLENFDLIFTMDASNYQNVRSLSHKADDLFKIKLLLNYSFPGENRPVPDPYFEGGFDHVFELLHTACLKVLEVHGVQ